MPCIGCNDRCLDKFHINPITVTWHGHSCYTVSAGGYSIVLDPYAPGSVPGLPPLDLTGDLVLCSHEHRDHGYREAVRISGAAKENPFEIQTIETYHDGQKGALRGENRIHVLSAEGIRIAHLGDLGCMPPLYGFTCRGLDSED